VIPYGIPRWDDYKKKSRKIEREQIKHFVYAGQITYQKGCDLLMQYFVSNQDVELHLYGSVSQGQQQLFEKYKGVKNIHFHGTVPKQLMMKEMSQYDVGIHMSRFDAYSLSVAEMMAAGLPVLVSNNTGIYSQVEKIGAGLVVDLIVKDIEAKIDEIRQPNRYNSFVENLDRYLTSNHKTYEEEILDFYKIEIL
jgi:glycosyltransferase involved in cell wall biosynthesis